MSDSMISTMYAVGNVVSSVALVLLNKRVFAGGFSYPMTLSCFHFAFTIVFYQLLAAFNVFSKPAIDMPQKEKFKVAFAGFASIGFMNLSLLTNSVGFYQVRTLPLVRVRLRTRLLPGARALPLHAATARCHSTPTSANPEPGSHPDSGSNQSGKPPLRRSASSASRPASACAADHEARHHPGDARDQLLLLQRIHHAQGEDLPAHSPRRRRRRHRHRRAAQAARAVLRGCRRHHDCHVPGESVSAYTIQASK